MRKNNELTTVNKDFSVLMRVELKMSEDADGKLIIESPMSSVPEGYYKMIDEYYEFIKIIENDNILLDKLIHVLEKYKNKE